MRHYKKKKSKPHICIKKITAKATAKYHLIFLIIFWIVLLLIGAQLISFKLLLFSTLLILLLYYTSVKEISVEGDNLSIHRYFCQKEIFNLYEISGIETRYSRGIEVLRIKLDDKSVRNFRFMGIFGKEYDEISSILIDWELRIKSSNKYKRKKEQIQNRIST